MLAQGLDLIDQSGGEHGIEARGDALVQLSAVGGQQGELQHAIGQPTRFLLQLCRHRQSAESENLQRAADPLGIVRRQPGRRQRIHPCQFGVQGRPAAFSGLGLYSLAQHRIGFRQIVQAIQQRAEIKHGAADQQGHPAACGDFGHQTPRIVTECRSRVGFRGIANVQQMMRREGKRFGIRFGRADIHATVDQRRIDTDDFQRKMLDQMDCERGLARGGGSHQKDRRRMRRFRHGMDYAAASCPISTAARSNVKTGKSNGRTE
jgi:hypothetical protein